MATIGEEFAVRWLHKNRCAGKVRGLSGDQCADLARRVAEAADGYAQQKHAELDRMLKEVMFGSLDDGNCQDCVAVRAREMVTSRHFAEVTKEHLSGAFDPGRVFPLDL